MARLASALPAWCVALGLRAGEIHEAPRSVRKLPHQRRGDLRRFRERLCLLYFLLQVSEPKFGDFKGLRLAQAQVPMRRWHRINNTAVYHWDQNEPGPLIRYDLAVYLPYAVVPRSDKHNS